VAWGTAIALVAGGAIVGTMARSEYKDLEAQQGAPNYIDIYAEKEGDIRKLNLTADALYVSGAIVAGLGTWVWFRVERPPVTIAPAVAGDGALLQVAGRF
jgi:hypothetical protein